VLDNSMARPVLPSKIRVPSVSSKLIGRPRLASLLASMNENTPIAVVVAPAGYGKTSLVASWLANLKRPAVAWLTLDEEDNSPIRFLPYLFAAFKEAGITAHTKEVGDPGSIETMISQLDNLILAVEERGVEIYCILDEYHLVNEGSDTHKAVSYLLAHIPSNLRTIIITRRVPHLRLPWLRLDEKLIEITASDLCCTQEDIVGFFDKINVVLPDKKAASILELTKGWPVAVKSLSLLDSLPQNSIVLTAHSPEMPAAIIDYLFEEVFEHLNTETQRFLLATAQVDFFCASLAEELTELDRASVARILNLLVTENIFIEEIHKKGYEAWFHYHPLFLAMLRCQALKTITVQTLNITRRACTWFEHNDHHNQSALCAKQIKNYPHIESLILRYWRTMYMEDNHWKLYQWGKMLPDEMLLSNPIVCCIMTLPCILADDAALASACADIARPYLQDKEVEFFAEAMAIGANVCLLQQRFEEANLAMDLALSLIPASDYFIRTWLRYTKPLISKNPDWNVMRITFSEDLPQVIAHGNKALICNYHMFLAQAEACLGNFASALGYAEKALSISSKSSYPYRTSFMNMYFARMIVTYHRGDISEAELYEKQYHAVVKENFAGYLASFAYAHKAHIEFARGNVTAADKLIIQSMNLSPYGILMMPMSLRFLEYLANAGVVSFEGFLEKTAKDYRDSCMLQRMTFGLEFIKGNMTVLLEVRTFADKISEDYRLEKIYALLLLALFEEASGYEEKAEDALLQALERAATEQIVQIFCNDYPHVLPILSRLSQMSPPAFVEKLFIRITQIAKGERPLVDKVNPVQLTQRETDVANLLIEGHSVKEIAQRLIISKDTVRKHIANTYTKLGIHSRTQLVLHFQ